MVKCLENQDDQQQLIETPHIMIIPTGIRESASSPHVTADPASVVIFASQSYLYNSLCMIKDLRWLNKTDSSDLPEHMRLNHLPALAGYLPV